MRKVMKIATSLLLVLSLMLCMVVSADYVPDPTVVQVSDPSAWRGDPVSMDIVGKTMKLHYSAQSKSSAVYTEKELYSESIEFKANFNPGDAWVAITIRTDMQDYMIWDMHENYSFLIREGGYVEFVRNHSEGKGGITGSNGFYTNLCDGNDHIVRVGAQEYNGKTYVRFAVDGEEKFSFVDNYPLNVELSYLQFNCYGNGASVNVTALGSNEFWDNNPIEKAQPTDSYSPVTGGFFMNQNQDSMDINMISDGRLSQDGTEYSYTGCGAMTTVNEIQAKQFRFKASLASSDGSDCYADYRFIQTKRTGIACTNGYALRIHNDGRIQLIRYINGGAQAFPSFETGKDFTQYHKVTVKVEKTGLLSSLISVWIDDETKAYLYKDEKYGPNLQAYSYFGVYNSTFTMTAKIKDFEIVGNEAYVVDQTATSQVILPDYLVEEGGDKLLHWVYSNGYGLYKGVSIRTVDKKEIAFVSYPDNTYILPDNHQYTQLYVVAVRVDGQEAKEQLIDLTADRSEYYCSNQKRIIVRPADATHDTAGFQTVDGEEFTVKGFNYIELRYGDHSTFEPAIDNVNTADYDPLQAETWLKTLSAYGYNTVRVFLVAGVRRSGNRGLTGPYETANGIYIPYMENFYDFLNRAQKYGIYTIFNFSENEMISSSYYRKKSGGASNQGILFSQDGMEAKADYVYLVLKYIQERNPDLLRAILAVQAQNEFYYENTWGPWVQTSGTYKYFDGTTYDMADNNSRHELAKHAAKTYYASLRKAIDKVDSAIMLCEGTFTLTAVGKDSSDPAVLGISTTAGKNDNRFPLTTEDYLDTAIDFLDIHVYWGGTQTPDELMTDQMDNNLTNTAYCKLQRKQKPIIMGEYGAFEIPGITDKTLEICNELQRAAMKNGMAGSLFWTMQILAANTDHKDGAISDDMLKYLEGFNIFE